MNELPTDYQAIYKAWSNFRKGKRPSRAIDEFAHSLESNISQLSTELTNGTYSHGGYQAVVLLEKKRRDLAVADVRDRVVHRLLYDYLLEIFDPTFDSDVWSCRTGKGLHKCLERTQNLLRKYEHSYVWRADITKFFYSVAHDVLLQCLKRKIGHDKTALRLCQEVISSYAISKQASKQGIPIGNLTSQIFANIYLHEFDRFVRHNLKPQAYVRYGDDFILFYPNRHAAHRLRVEANSYPRETLSLNLNPKNDVVVLAADGLHFLGHAVTDRFAVVDKRTTYNVLKKVDWNNAASYRSLFLAQEAKKQIDWILLEKGVDI